MRTLLSLLMVLGSSLSIYQPVWAQEDRVPTTVNVPPGAYIKGSGQAERELGYQLDEAAYGHSRTRERKWYDREFDRKGETLPGFEITRTQITNAQYAVFISETGHRAPAVTQSVWQGYRLVHPFSRTRRHAWSGSSYPAGRGEHPVVMVSFGDATAFAAWLSDRTGQVWRLPTEGEWEKSARGESGLYFPWGNAFAAAFLNSHDAGPFDTVPVGQYPDGASPYGALDMAGNVFEWTSTTAGARRHIVKGGSWDDRGCGVCRAAARHSRPDDIKHILIGFRLVRIAVE